MTHKNLVIISLNLNRNHFLVLKIRDYLLEDRSYVTMNLPNILEHKLNKKVVKYTLEFLAN